MSALLDGNPYVVVIAGVRHKAPDEATARAIAEREVRAWLALGYKGRTAKVYYRDGSLIVAVDARLVNVQALARAFSRHLREALSSRQMREAIERNRTRHPDVCHSADHCDSNMVMEAAFVECFGREPELAGEEDTPDLLLWNAAWDLARESEFNVECVAKSAV